MDFIPETPTDNIGKVPFFEDSAAAGVAGRRTNKPIRGLQGEVIDALAKLGAGAVQFTPGAFTEGGLTRYGFRITFYLGAIPGRMEIAALPLRSETPSKKDRALAQALYLVRDSLRAMHDARYYHPGDIPLLPYLIGSNGRTVRETLVETLALPERAGGGV